MNAEVIVVGSGPGGVNAAAALIEAGRSVLLIDYGNEDSRYAPLIPRRSFTELRRGDSQQHRYLLGDRYEGIPLGAVRVGAQLTPPRLHVFRDADERVPVDSEVFSGSASLAKGGFGAAWAAGVFPFSEDEVEAMGLTLADLEPHYEAAAARIGVCGDRDDLARFFRPSASMMPALEVDSNAEAILDRYLKRRERFNASGFYLGRTHLAVCSRRHRERGPEEYLDMAYWADLDRSVYRPQWTLEELRVSSRFRYLDRRFVDRFREEHDRVTVEARHADTGGRESYQGKALVLAAGTIGTAWIVLRSLECYERPVPILCNPYAYVPMLNLGHFGRPVRDRRHSLAQLTAMLRSPGSERRTVQAQVFSYRSLLTFKLMKEAPLGHREALRIMRLLMPYFAILGIHHEDRPSDRKRCVLLRGVGSAPDRLHIDYDPSAQELRSQREDERQLLRFFRRLGCWPIRTVRPGHGASIHYAGTFPIQPNGGELSCDADGRLRATRSVYLADGSVFPWLPAKGLTFTLMANADRVGSLLGRRWR